MTKAEQTPEEAGENEELQPTETAAGGDEVESFYAEDAKIPMPEGEDPRIAALQSELDKTKDQLLRTAAELENTRRRAQKERADASKFGIAGFARDMLSVADNLERAISAVPDEAKEDERIKNLIQGIEATQRELLRSLEKNDVKPINPEGEVFNPNFHEVMFETPGTGQPPGTVIQVMEVGYMIGERLLRPARVGVAKDEGGYNESGPATGNGSETGGQIDTQA